MNPAPLSGVLVVDLTRVLAGPYCAMMLAELGARVVKVEPPGGDDSRRFAPFTADGSSAYFASLNRGKESIVLDLKADADRAVLLALVRRADVLVENYRPGTLEKLGLGYDRLREVNPRLVFASVSGFGQTGPWSRRPAYDLIVQAASGLMSLTGPVEGPAYKCGTSIGDITGGLFTLSGITSALFQRERTGKGMRIDVAMFDGQLAILESGIMRYAATGQTPRSMGNRHPSITPFEPYETADGPLVIAVGNDSLFVKLCQAIERTELVTDPRFAVNRDRCQNAEAVKIELEKTLCHQPRAVWIERLEAAGVPCTPIYNVVEAVELPQSQARNMLVDAGGLKMAGNPVKIAGVEDPPTRCPAPDLNADGPRIRAELALSEPEG